MGSPVLGWDNGCYNKVDDVLVELWAEQLGSGRGGEGGSAQQNWYLNVTIAVSKA